MYCKNCGNEIEDKAVVCVKCGTATANAAPPPQQKIPNHLVGAILVTVLCCMPFGVVSIVYAARVNGQLAAGDIHGATKSSNLAKTWMWWGFGVGLVISVIYWVFLIVVEA